MISRLFYSNTGEGIQIEEGGDVESKSNVGLNVGLPQSFDEQEVSEYEPKINNESVSQLTFDMYEDMDSKKKSKLSNCVCQCALKARQYLPTDHGLFCLVVSHLLRNAHRYFKMEKPSDFQHRLLNYGNMPKETREEVIKKCMDANKKVRAVCDLKRKNRIVEQQQCIAELKQNYHSFRNMSAMSGIPLKSVHNWCSQPKAKRHKSREMSQLRKKEFEQFLLQDTISFEHPCKKFSGKRFLRDTLEVTRKKYLQQTEYHKNGIISMSSMKQFRPSYIMLCSKTPLDQCLCDSYENF